MELFAAPVAVRASKVRDCSGGGVKFNSPVVPPYLKKSPRVPAALQWLYLKGISTGDMSEGGAAGAAAERGSEGLVGQRG